MFSYPSAVERLAGGFVKGGGAHGFLVLGGALSCERVVSHKVFAFVWWFVSKRDAIGVEARLEMLHGAVAYNSVCAAGARVRM